MTKIKITKKEIIAGDWDQYLVHYRIDPKCPQRHGHPHGSKCDLGIRKDLQIWEFREFENGLTYAARFYLGLHEEF